MPAARPRNPGSVPHAPEIRHNFLPGAGGLGGIRETHVYRAPSAGKHWARLAGVIAQRDHHVEGLATELVQVLGAMSGEIDTHTVFISQPGNGSAYQPRAGTYYLKISGIGDWQVEAAEL